MGGLPRQSVVQVLATPVTIAKEAVAVPDKMNPGTQNERVDKRVVNMVLVWPDAIALHMTGVRGTVGIEEETEMEAEMTETETGNEEETDMDMGIEIVKREGSVIEIGNAIETGIAIDATTRTGNARNS